MVKVLDLEKKKQVLDVLARDEKQANVARHFVIEESTVSSIKKRKDNILNCYNDSSVSSRSVIKHVRKTTPERVKLKNCSAYILMSKPVKISVLIQIFFVRQLKVKFYIFTIMAFVYVCVLRCTSSNSLLLILENS